VAHGKLLFQMHATRIENVVRPSQMVYKVLNDVIESLTSANCIIWWSFSHPYSQPPPMAQLGPTHHALTISYLLSFGIIIIIKKAQSNYLIIPSCDTQLILFTLFSLNYYLLAEFDSFPYFLSSWHPIPFHPILVPVGSQEYVEGFCFFSTFISSM